MRWWKACAWPRTHVHDRARMCMTAHACAWPRTHVHVPERDTIDITLCKSKCGENECKPAHISHIRHSWRGKAMTLYATLRWVLVVSWWAHIHTLYAQCPHMYVICPHVYGHLSTRTHTHTYIHIHTHVYTYKDGHSLPLWASEWSPSGSTAACYWSRTAKHSVEARLPCPGPRLPRPITSCTPACVHVCMYMIMHIFSWAALFDGKSHSV